MSELLQGREILIVEDEHMVRKHLVKFFENAGASCTGVATFEEGKNALANLDFDYAWVDVHLPDGLGLDLLEVAKANGDIPVIIMTAAGGVEMAVDAMRLGAADYLTKPFDPREAPLVLARVEAGRRSSRLQSHARKSNNVSSDDAGLFFGSALEGFRSQLDKVLAVEGRLKSQLPPILIEGETGTGKTTVARWLHANGARANKELVVVNCAALPEQLAEAELFGHEKGAFTDAKQARIGLFEAADGGTLFLDEIASLSESLQAKVLTAIEESRIRKVGSTKDISVNVRLITASNRPLEQMVKEGSFREDLYHRLNLLKFEIPPLRERGGDAVRLAQHLLAQLCVKYRMKNAAFSPRCIKWIERYEWPGNVRELQHEIERAMILGDAEALEFVGIGERLGDQPSQAQGEGPVWLKPGWSIPQEGFSVETAVIEFIELALAQTGGNRTQAAKLLGVNRDYIRYRLTRKDKGAE
ncbi:sigma-54 dependent transcriptional regulator [Pelagicoccus enzymogenes]|uniref:sigma-54-dependent transcriptional regulator n=1 Tax=Pelagicoccus enzymogenes TaxID=2773457 RepID=UPI00280FD13F|nr:sigma-54 dependent transcriptional regulator [Pelagicoccus enzymogenes]MDQ8199998.1 sigma-54 dependent transcriptional regulator [Pelagicoccus enzymogenes]